MLPELDGIRLAILGLHNCQDSTVVHMHASGPRSEVIYGPDELYPWATLWVRDNGGHWHATRTPRPQRDERRGGAARGSGAAAEPGHRLDRAARRRAIG